MRKKFIYFYLLVFSTLLIHTPSSFSLTVTFNGPTELKTYSLMYLEPNLEFRNGDQYAVYDPANAFMPVCKDWDYTSGTLNIGSGEWFYLNLGFTGMIEVGGTSKAWNRLYFLLYKNNYEITSISMNLELFVPYYGSTGIELNGSIFTPFGIEFFDPNISGNQSILTISALIGLRLYPGVYEFYAQQNSGTNIDYYEMFWPPEWGEPPIFGATADFSQTGFINFTTDPGGNNPIVSYDLYSVTATVPEPSTMVILVIGLLGLAGFRNKLKK